MGNNHTIENKRLRREYPEKFTHVSQSNSLSQAMDAKAQIRKEREEQRFYELEELIIDTPSLDPSWAGYISEYNNLKIRLQV
jgi:hypothetical protein